MKDEGRWTAVASMYRYLIWRQAFFPETVIGDSGFGIASVPSRQVRGWGLVDWELGIGFLRCTSWQGGIGVLQVVRIGFSVGKVQVLLSKVLGEIETLHYLL